MSKKLEKISLDFQRLLETQSFKSEEELKAFMDGMIGQEISSFPEDVLTDAEKAVDLCYQAYESDPEIGEALIHEALMLDFNCVEAYEYLGLLEPSPYIAIVFLEKAVAVARKKFDANYIKKNKGDFWLIHETRPFMRSMYHLANNYRVAGQYREAVKIYEEILELNPTDNLGARYFYLLILIDVNEAKKFQKYDKLYANDQSTFMQYNRALFSFQQEGNSVNSINALKKAIQLNKYVVPLLISDKIVFNTSPNYTEGTKAEAEDYCNIAKPSWAYLPGAVAWLKSFKA